MLLAQMPQEHQLPGAVSGAQSDGAPGARSPTTRAATFGASRPGGARPTTVGATVSVRDAHYGGQVYFSRAAATSSTPGREDLGAAASARSGYGYASLQSQVDANPNPQRRRSSNQGKMHEELV